MHAAQSLSGKHTEFWNEHYIGTYSNVSISYILHVSLCMQRELDTSCRKDVFAHFHGINHRVLQSVVDGLLMIAHHLTQAEVIQSAEC